MWRFNDDDLLSNADNKAMFSFIRRKLNPDDHFMIWEPRTVTLLTGRVGTTLAWLAANPPASWPAVAKKMKVRYLIFNKVTDPAFIAAIQQSHIASKTWENPSYVIYQIFS